MMSPFFLRRSALVLALFIFAASGWAQQDTLRVQFESDPQRSADVAACYRNTVLFASVNDLAAALGLRVLPVRALPKLEMDAGQTTIIVTESNPFIQILEAGERPVIHQLLASVLSVSDHYFVPLQSFLSEVSGVLPEPARYDDRTGVLRIGRPVPPPHYDLTTVTMESKANGMLIRIPTNRPSNDVEYLLQKDGWLSVTIVGARADSVALNSLEPVGLVKRVVAIQSPGSVQLSFKLSSAVEAPEMSRDPATKDIILTLRTPPDAKPEMKAETKPSAASSGSLQKVLEKKRDRWAMDVIVIDAGHGGKDWGAIGVSGVREKDVTLGVALKLGALIKKNLAGVKVVYTRDTDRFIELDRRGKIANDAEGKLFISIHCNSLKRKPSPTRGFEVYLLRPGRTDEAVAIAERENSVVQMEEGYEARYKHLTDENFILVTMAQSAYVRASEGFADMLQQEMEEYAGVPNRGVKQAGFYVLVGASMPNVLVETAYLSNRSDERFLKSTGGQEKIAESIYRAVKKYKQEYEKLLREGSAPLGVKQREKAH